MYNEIFEKIILPFGDLFSNTHISSFQRLLKESQWWTKEEIENYQNEKLKKLIEHCYNNVPYYHSLLNQLKLSPKDFRNMEDLQKLPILTKDVIRRNSKKILAKNFQSYKPSLNRTGGSTGEPLVYYLTKKSVSISLAATYRGWNWSGWKPGDKRVTLAGSSLIPNNKLPLKKKIRYYLERNLPLSAVSLDDNKLRHYVKLIKKFKPLFIRGYPTALFQLACFIRENKVNNLSFKAALTTAEVLLPNYREEIENSFKCRVFDGYGLRDGNGNAMECEKHDGLHVSIEPSIMEIINNDKPVKNGGIGKIILTDLYNYAMPFIRYDSGDLGSFSQKKCSCGRSSPLLGSIQGRSCDILTFSNGRTLSGPAMTLLFNRTNIYQYQLKQKERDSLEIYIIKKPTYNNKDEKILRETISHHIGSEIKIKFCYVPSIKPSPSGKNRFTISELKN